ncbi:MAG: aminotransferase class V-fold PLP-dependent enzyme [Gemmatimonadetes bacterium]|nr:aminotransferase class V-fold PLP-dependent enzyme [Gemmatimonadota bacterium]
MLSCQKQLFSLPDNVHYLNCAYMSPLLRRVEQAGIEGLRRKRLPAGIAPEDFFRESDHARALFGRLVNAEPARIAIIPAASYGLATAARNTPLSRGRSIVLAHDQYPSNVYIWQRLAREAGAEVRTVIPPDAPGRGAAWNARLLDAIDARTAVVALGNVHWADGTRFDLERIGAHAREVGAALVVDGTQSVGALPFDVARVQPDALVCAAYKWLLGPYSIGLAYFGPRYDAGIPLEETWLARVHSEDFRRLVEYEDEYRAGAVRYDVGERSNFIVLPMLIAALEQVLEWAPARIQEYCRALSAELLEEARALGYRVEEEAWRGAHLFGVRTPPGLDLERLQRLLAEQNVIASLRGSALRVSPHVYNDRQDIEALLDVLRGALETGRRPGA